MRISNNSYKTKNLKRCVFNPTFSRIATLNSPSPNSDFRRDSFHSSFLSNFSSRLPSVCRSDSNPLQNKQVLCGSFDESPCLFHKNQYLFNSLLVSSIIKLELHSPNKNRFRYTSLPSFSESLSSQSIFNHNCDSIHSVYRISHGSHCRPFSSSSADATSASLSAEEDTVQSVSADCADELNRGKKMVNDNKKDVPENFVSEVVDIINNGEDVESRLSKVASKFHLKRISKIFLVLNSQRISGLKFFEFIRKRKPELYMNADLCSLIIDNCGSLDDYETMKSLLNEFKSKNICLAHKAFGFLPASASTSDSLMESTMRMVNLLNEVGGSCCNSGICSLLEMFCKVDSFEMAKYVIEMMMTKKKDSYYHILIRENCRRDRIEDALSIITDMGNSGSVPKAIAYNYIIGNLCKNDKMDEACKVLEEMNKAGTQPDASTFEVLIHFLCRSGKVDLAYKFLDHMKSKGIEPLPKTHFSLIKALFMMEKYEEAHKYVVDSSVEYTKFVNLNYSVLANLYREKGDILRAREVLVEMMEKGLRPNFVSYINVVKYLKLSGRGNLAMELKGRYSKFVIESRPRT